MARLECETHYAQVAEGVWQLAGFPPHAINCYLIGDTLIDAKTRWARRRILNELKGHSLRLLALTHCHPDHQGAAKAVCESFNVPLACHQADQPVMEGRAPMAPHNWVVNLGDRMWSGPPCPVQQPLQDGDLVAGFRVIHAPGHTPGHVFYFRDSDRTVLAGDVLANISFLTGQPGLREPPRLFSVSPEQNRQSIRLLAALKPSLVCFGHGPPLRDLTHLERFVDLMK
ncbi:MAG TPA: MBL fold metallo-hydrolase [Gemmataceae bacterium]|nr:MBL fold metallo-hydrolase [Gemmataceae bacterium]